MLWIDVSKIYVLVLSNVFFSTPRVAYAAFDMYAIQSVANVD